MSPFVAQIISVLICVIMLALWRKPINVVCFYILFRPIVQPFAYLGYKLTGAIPLTSLFALVMITISFSQALFSRRATPFPKNSTPLYGIAFVAVASVAVTISVTDSISTIFKFLLNISILLIVYNSVDSISDVKKIALSFAYTSIIPSLYGYYQYVTETGHAWKSAYYAGSRMDSFLGEYNAYGEFLCLSIFGSLVALSLEESQKRRKLLYIIMANTLCSLVLSLNRGSWIALSFSIIVASLVATKGKSLKVIIPIGLAVLILFGGVVKDRFSDLSAVSNGRSRNTFAGRIEGWKMIIPLVEERPFLGYGAGTSTVLYEKHFGLSLAPHNDYIRIWCEIGILGFLFYAFFLIRELTASFIRSTRSQSFYIPWFACSLYLVTMSVTQNIYTNVTVFPMAITIYALFRKVDKCSLLKKKTGNIYASA